jgi:glycerophosphoryl diester phosphodiesterase
LVKEAVFIASSLLNNYMKKIIAALFIIALASCTANKKIMQPLEFASNPVVAHRGAFKKNGFPENSIASLKEAIRLNCAGSEFDVRMSADDSLVINHDPHYHQLEIEKTNYHELIAHKLSNGETLPTLRQYLLAGLDNNKHTRLVVEIKPSSTKEKGRQIAEKVLQLVTELKAGAMCVYISFDYEILKKLLEIDPHLSTQYLNGDIAPEQLKADGISGADYHFSVFQKNPQWISSAQKNGIILNAWTVNEEKDIKWLLENKFDFITTNEPELALEILKQ